MYILSVYSWVVLKSCWIEDSSIWIVVIFFIFSESMLGYSILCFSVRDTRLNNTDFVPIIFSRRPPTVLRLGVQKFVAGGLLLCWGWEFLTTLYGRVAPFEFSGAFVAIYFLLPLCRDSRFRVFMLLILFWFVYVEIADFEILCCWFFDPAIQHLGFIPKNIFPQNNLLDFSS